MVTAGLRIWRRWFHWIYCDLPQIYSWDIAGDSTRHAGFTNKHRVGVWCHIYSMDTFLNIYNDCTMGIYTTMSWMGVLENCASNIYIYIYMHCYFCYWGIWCCELGANVQKRNEPIRTNMNNSCWKVYTSLRILGQMISAQFCGWGNLNNNLYFLLLGLGVDDAFVLTSEYLTHSREAKTKARMEVWAAGAGVPEIALSHAKSF